MSTTLQCLKLSGTLLLFEYSFDELYVNIIPMVVTSFLQNCMYLASTVIFIASKIIQCTDSNVFYANLLAMMEKSLLQNIIEWDK